MIKHGSKIIQVVFFPFIFSSVSRKELRVTRRDNNSGIENFVCVISPERRVIGREERKKAIGNNKRCRNAVKLRSKYKYMLLLRQHITCSYKHTNV